MSNPTIDLIAKDAALLKQLTNGLANEITPHIVKTEHWLITANIKGYVTAWLSESNHGSRKVLEALKANEKMFHNDDDLAPLARKDITIPPAFFKKADDAIWTSCPLVDVSTWVDTRFPTVFCKTGKFEPGAVKKAINGSLKAYFKTLVDKAVKATIKTARDEIDIGDKITALAWADSKFNEELTKLTKTR